MNKIKYIAAVVIAIVGLGLQQAKADQFSFTLNLSNLGFGVTGPFVSVTVNRTDSTHATFTFQSLVGGGFIYLLGHNGAVAVNVNATSWTLGSLTNIGTNSGSGFTPGPWSDGGAANEDGFGSFNQTIDSFDSFTHSSTTISFSITNTSGTWATAANVLIGNGPQGNLAAAGILATAYNGGNFTSSQGAISTGYASGVGPSVPSVPDGGTTAMLLGAAFGVLGMARRFLKM